MSEVDKEYYEEYIKGLKEDMAIVISDYKELKEQAKKDRELLGRAYNMIDRFIPHNLCKIVKKDIEKYLNK